MTRVAPEEVVSMDENEFVKRNEGLVHNICQRLDVPRIKKETGLEYEDLFMAGLMAMIKAKRKFKPEYGWQFSTYAVPMIRGEILRHALINGKVHIPRPIKEAYLKIAQAGLLQESDEVIAETLGLSIKQVQMAKLMRTEVASLNELIKEENGDATVEDMIGTDFSAADLAEDNLVMQDFLSRLSPQQRHVWEVYRQTNCGNQQTIAKIVGVSQAQVSRIMKTIFAKAEQYGKILREDGKRHASK